MRPPVPPETVLWLFPHPLVLPLSKQTVQPLRKHSKLLAVFVAGLMLCVTAVYWHSEMQETLANRQLDFEDAANRVRLYFLQRLSSYELVSRGAKGFFEASTSVSREEYRDYVSALQLDKTDFGLQGFAIARFVPAQGLARHTAEMRLQDFAQYQVKPPGERAFYAPIVLIEPYTDRNLNAIGFDIASNPNLVDALLQSQRSGKATLSKKTRLVQDAGKDLPAVVLYAPLYTRGVPLDTAPQRQAATVGWVSLPFRIHDLVQSLAAQLDQDIHLEIFEGDSLAPADRLYGGPVASDQAAAQKLLRTERALELGGRRWTLVLHALPGFDKRVAEDLQHNLIALFGVAMSLLLGWVAWLTVTGRERAEAIATTMTQDLRAQQIDREAILNALPDVLFELGLDGRYHQYHTSQANLLAAPSELFMGKLLTEVLPEKASAICLQALQEAHAKGFSSGHQIELPIGAGQRWFELSVARKESADTPDPRFIMISRDITERKEAENHLLLVGQVFKSSHEGIFITDSNNRILSANQACTDITGYLESELVGQDPRMLSSGRQDRAFYAAMWHDIQRAGNWEGEIWNQRKNGEIYPEWLSISAVRDSGGSIFQYIGILRDLTDSKAAQEQIDFLANYDPLTQLPNHKLLQDRTQLALATAKRTGTQTVMMFVDIDRFQAINDSLGRPVGDQILQMLAARLTANLQSDDTVCRQGSDEFVLLLPNTHANGAAHIASRLLALIQEPMLLEAGNEISLTACIGIALYPDNGDDFHTLSQCADAALLRAKRDGRGGFKFFTEQIQTDAKEALLVESHLRRALSKGEFVLHYQPQVDALSLQIVGAEALIRWQHPQWGLVSPARFISIAEASGQILAIGTWVMHTAAQQIAAWQRDGLPVVPVAVNLSALQFHQAGLCEAVAEIIKASGLNPELLELELTESVAMEDSSFTLDQIGKLHAMGLKLSIDDFGTGYSSLSYLRRYQIDKLKIDQSFVRDLDREQDDGAIVRAIVQMAHGLGFKTIAEGVETQRQLDFLRAQGCDEMQGYFFGRPMPAPAFAELLRQRA